MNTEAIKQEIAQKEYEITILKGMLEGTVKVNTNSIGYVLSDLTAVAAAIFDEEIAAILSPSRRTRLVSARMAITVRALQIGIRIIDIANFLQRNHSTIIYLATEYENRLLQYPEDANLMQRVINYRPIKLPA